MARILVVDDEPQLVELIRFNLELKNYDVECASNGRDILAKLGLEPTRDATLPDLVILDLVMSDLDGFTVASRMHQYPATKALPIVVLTGKAQMQHFFKDLPNVKGFLSKPFNIMDLLELVAGLTKK